MKTLLFFDSFKLMSYFREGDFSFLFLAILVLCFALLSLIALLLIVYKHFRFIYNKHAFTKSTKRIFRTFKIYYKEIEKPKSNERRLSTKLFGRKFLQSKLTRSTLQKIILKAYKKAPEIEQRKLERLFVYLKFEREIRKNISNKDWHIAAEAIHYAGAMNIKKCYPKILPFVDVRNRILRNEARFAAIRLAPEDPLEFLDQIEFDLSNWEQLGIIDTIQKYKHTEIKNIGKYLNHPINSVVILSLKIIEVFGIKNETENIKKCFTLTFSKSVKKQCIYTLGYVGKTIDNYFLISKLKDKREIDMIVPFLISIRKIGIEEDQIDPLIYLLYSNEYDIVNYTALIFKTNEIGLELLEAILPTLNTMQVKAVDFALKYEPHLSNY